MEAGKRNRLVSFERGAVSTNDYGEEVKAWGQTVEAWARVRYGTGQERREAAQERASVVITAECDWTPTLAGVTETDRIQFDGAAWDIVGRALVGLNREIHFTAVRST